MRELSVGKAIEHLLGPGVAAAQLNDDRLGRGLDQRYQHGVSELFGALALWRSKHNSDYLSRSLEPSA